MTSSPPVMRSISILVTTNSRSKIAATSAWANQSSRRWHQPHHGAPKVRKTRLSPRRARDCVFQHGFGVLGCDLEPREKVQHALRVVVVAFFEDAGRLRLDDLRIRVEHRQEGVSDAFLLFLRGQRGLALARGMSPRCVW